MKTITAIIVIVMAWNTMSHAEEMTYAEIVSAYGKSYEHESLNKYRTAIKDIGEIYRLYPDTYTVNLRLGWLYYLNKNYANALEHLEKARKVYPNSIEAPNIEILVLAARHDWVKVEELCAFVLKTDYCNTTANYWYAYTLKKQGKHDLALKVARRMLAIYPTSIDFLQELGENLYLNGQKEEGMTVFGSLAILNPGNKTVAYYVNLDKDG